MYQPKSGPSSNLAPSNSLTHVQHLESGPSTVEPNNGGNNASNNSNLASKQRLRWTNELHERFVNAVAQLGGPDSESPLSLFVLFLCALLRFYLFCGVSNAFGNI